MRDPAELYQFETDTDLQDLRASVLLVSLGGFIDAGHTQRLLTDHLLATLEHTVVASFDIDQLLDYRARRPAMTFDHDRWSSYADPSLLLHRVIDADGDPFLLLDGPEPDYQWERVVEAIRGLVRLLGVKLTVSVHGIPMAVPHTRPVGLTAHATDPRLIADHASVFGTIQVPGSIDALLHLRLGESGMDAIGFSVHVPHYLAQTEYADASLTGLEAVIGVTGLALPTTDLAASAGLNRAEIAREIESSTDVAEVVADLERQYDTFMEGRQRHSLLATDVSELPSADEIGEEFEQFLREQSDLDDLAGEQRGSGGSSDSGDASGLSDSSDRDDGSAPHA